jgi:hypothetical protein
MHMFLSTPTKLVFVDKRNYLYLNVYVIFIFSHDLLNHMIIRILEQNNPLEQAPGQPAASAEYDLETNTLRALSVNSNTFCSAGSWLGNGIMLHTGGDGNAGKFVAGGQTLRFYDPAAGNWVEKIGFMPSKRWYPTLLS